MQAQKTALMTIYLVSFCIVTSEWRLQTVYCPYHIETLCRACYDRYRIRGRDVRKKYKIMKDTNRRVNACLFFNQASFFFYRYCKMCMNTAICTAHLGQAIHMRPHSLLLLLFVVIFF